MNLKSISIGLGVLLAFSVGMNISDLTDNGVGMSFGAGELITVDSLYGPKPGKTAKEIKKADIEKDKVNAYIFTDENGRVTLRHYAPEELSEERKAEGLPVTSLPPKPEKQAGYRADLYADINTGEVWYEFTREEDSLTDNLLLLNAKLDALSTP